MQLRFYERLKSQEW